MRQSGRALIGPDQRQALGRPVRWTQFQVGQAMRSTGRQLVVSYSMGKTGSSALAAAIDRLPGYSACQTHGLTTSARRAALAERSTWPIPVPPFGPWSGDFARLYAMATRRPLLLVVGVRDPVAQAISSFLEVGEYSGVLRDLDEAEPNPAVAQQRFEEFLLLPNREHGRLPQGIRDWFSDEMRTATGIDVYAQPFPHEEGFLIVEAERHRVLILRQEDLRQRGPRALARFLGLGDEVPIPETNLTANSRYPGLYRTLTSDLRLPPEVLDAALESRYCRHFYAPEERATMRERWRPKVPTSYQ